MEADKRIRQTSICRPHHQHIWTEAWRGNWILFYDGTPFSLAFQHTCMGRGINVIHSMKLSLANATLSLNSSLPNWAHVSWCQYRQGGSIFLRFMLVAVGVENGLCSCCLPELNSRILWVAQTQILLSSCTSVHILVMEQITCSCC